MNRLTSKVVVWYSGGRGSFLATLLLKRQGYTNVTLLFCDTNTEHPTLYKFLEETTSKVFPDYTFIHHKEFPDLDIFGLFKKVHFMGNSFSDPCSKQFKRVPGNRITKELNPDYIVSGLSFDEEVRVKRFRETHGEKALLPLADDGFIDMGKLWKDALKEYNIEEPFLYTIGLTHNNCGGFCVKAGLGHYRNLYERDKEAYLEFEKKEEEVYPFCKSKFPFLVKSVGGAKRRLTLREYRLEFLEPNKVDDEMLTTNTGCNACMLEVDDEQVNK
jgi:hypothetical protein